VRNRACLLSCSIVLLLGCAGGPPPKPAADPNSAADFSDSDLTKGIPANREDVETCRERILNEGVPSSGGAPVAGAELAQKAEAARKNKDMAGERAAYFDLISQAPGSPYIPFAYFEFAELFKQEAASDPTKLPLVEEALQQALSQPAPKNRLFLVASYRMAQVYALENKKPEAHDAYQRTIDDATTNTRWDCALPVAEAAQRAIEALQKPEDM